MFRSTHIALDHMMLLTHGMTIGGNWELVLVQNRQQRTQTETSNAVKEILSAICLYSAYNVRAVEYEI